MAFERGIAPALAMLDAARQSDPQAALFQEARLNGVAYRLFRNGKQPDGLALFRKIVEMFPASSNAYDSLSEALEATGDRAGAAATARKGLQVLDREQLPDARKAQLR